MVRGCQQTSQLDHKAMELSAPEAGYDGGRMDMPPKMG